MRLGPIGIDMAGILIDHYYPLDKDSVRSFLNYFRIKLI